MAKKEAAARLKINKMLEDSGWRLCDQDGERANVDVETRLNPEEKIHLHDMGDDFEYTKAGFIDYLLLDDNQRPIAVLEAKRESISPLSAKEQARNYANGMHVRYVILSNGNSHFLWDMYEGNPEPISRFPTLESLQESQQYRITPESLADEIVDEAYIATSQLPTLKESPDWLAGGEARDEFIKRTN